MNRRVTTSIHQEASLSDREIHRITIEYLLSLAKLHTDDYLSNDNTQIMEDIPAGHGRDITQVKRPATALDVQVINTIITINRIKREKESESQASNTEFELRVKIAKLERELAKK